MRVRCRTVAAQANGMRRFSGRFLGCCIFAQLEFVRDEIETLADCKTMTGYVEHQRVLPLSLLRDFGDRFEDFFLGPRVVEKMRGVYLTVDFPAALPEELSNRGGVGNAEVELRRQLGVPVDADGDDIQFWLWDRSFVFLFP